MYKVALSSLAITAAVSAAAGFGINAIVNKNEKNVNLKMAKIPSGVLYNNAEATDDISFEDSSDAPALNKWKYDADTKYYLRKGTTLAQNDFVTDIKMAEGYGSTFKFNGNPCATPDTLSPLGELDNNKWGWKYKKAWGHRDGQLAHPIKSPVDGKHSQQLFTDFEGTLWITADSAGLFYKKYDSDDWHPADNFKMDTKSNILTNLFEDSQHTLWSFPNGAGLQYKLPGKDKWNTATGCTGEGDWRDLMFEDSSHTLWVAGKTGGLQYKKLDGSDTWHKANSTCTLTNGRGGSMIEDFEGTLWAMGKESGIQYKAKGESDWHDADPSTCKIKDGEFGSILEDSSHILWAKGKGSGLQYKKPNDMVWHDAGPGCGLNNGMYGFIFEDSLGNIWVTGQKNRLYIKFKGKDSWEVFAGWPNGEGGMIYEDSSHTVWVEDIYGMTAGFKIGLDRNSISKLAPTLVRPPQADSSFVGGFWGHYIEDMKTGRLWISSMVIATGNYDGYLTYVDATPADYWVQTYNGIEVPGVEQKVDTSHPKNNPPVGKDPRIDYQLPNSVDVTKIKGKMKIDNNLYVNVADAITIMPTNPTYKGASDGKIEISGSIKNQNSVLKMSKNKGTWEPVVTNIITGLVEGDSYKFKWVANDGANYIGTTESEISLGEFPILGTNKVKVTATPKFKPTPITSKGETDGKIEVTDFTDKYSKLQYKSSTANGWKDVKSSGLIEGLAPGIYNFQWVGKLGENFIDGTKSKSIGGDVTIADSNLVNVPTNITISTTDATYKGASDGQITIEGSITDQNSVLRMSKNNGSWEDVKIKIIPNLVDGDSFKFKWVANSGLQYIGNKATEKEIPGTFVISENKEIKAPSMAPKFKSTSLTMKDAGDGKIKVTDFADTYSKLQYKLSSASNWTDVKASGLIEGLTPGDYSFQWVGKHGENFMDGSKTKSINGNITVADSNLVNAPTNITISTTDATYKGASDGEIKISGSIKNQNSVLKISKNGRPWVPVTGNTITGLVKDDSFKFKWVANSGLQYIGDKATEKVVPGTFIIYEINKIKIPMENPTFKPETPLLKSEANGKIKVTDFVDTYSKLQYKLSSTNVWIDVKPSGLIENLKSGTYNFRWVGKNGEEYVNGSKVKSLKDVVVKESKHISIPLEPNITIKSLTAVGAIDGEIHIGAYANAHSKLQYKLSTETDSEWKEIPKSGLDLTRLGETIFNFKWAPTSSGDSYLVDGNEESYISLTDRKIDASSLVDIPANPILTSTDPTTVAVEDGTVRVRNYNDLSGKSVLKYSINGGPLIEVTGDITNLAPETTVEFKWVLIEQDESYTNGLKESQAGLIKIGNSVNVPLPTEIPQFVNNNVSEDGKTDGSIYVTNHIDLYSELKYREITSDNLGLWKLVPTDGKIEGLAVGTYEFKWIPKEGYGTYPDGSTKAIVQETSLIEVECSIKVKTNAFSGNDNEKVDSAISPAKVEFVENFYHDFAIFRVSHVGEDISEISYIDYQNPAPQLVNSIEEASSSNQLVTKLNMADGTTIYIVETDQDGKRTIVVEKIDKNGKWLSAMKAEKVGEGSYKMLSDTDDILNTFKSQKSEYGKLTFHMAEEVSGGSNSQDDEASTTDEPNDAQASSVHHIWNLANKPKPVDVLVEQADDTIAISYGNVRTKLDASKLNGLSGDLATSNSSSSFPWWTLSFLALPPIAGILWFVLRKRRKAKD